ncbi:hypothetical protein Ppa06_66940 [Planomonospora parontospora subsp. parontospora]|uniref:Uncharacterized protein n=2 Tax=Planomonospora parontospora TaxID=58119 RepID=A0AA37BNL1_9ACTN|nr:hypothetical protein GCM10010126_67620 [Planomonospora parontospora]GII12896.1 hypothetical protein Ppa06_66940 [Planomonospora parontospora subsp. parontospora]
MRAVRMRAVRCEGRMYGCGGCPRPVPGDRVRRAAGVRPRDPVRRGALSRDSGTVQPPLRMRPA